MNHRVLAALAFGSWFAASSSASAALYPPPAAKVHFPRTAKTAASTPVVAQAVAPTPGAASFRDYVVEPMAPATTAVTLRNINSQEIGTFNIPADGHADAATAAELKHFFRCRRTNREKAIAPGTLSLLVSVAQHWPGRTIDVISGFRARPYGAPHSKHFVGHAIDIRVEGVRSALVRDTIWRENHEVGVGHYTAENFVHIDSRPGEPDMAWSSRAEGAPLLYNPYWSKHARGLSARPTRVRLRS